MLENLSINSLKKIRCCSSKKNSLLLKLLENVDAKILDLTEENTRLKTYIEIMKENKNEKLCHQLQDTIYINKTL